MPQNALLQNVAKTTAGAQSTLNLDSGGNLLSTNGGLKSSLNITAAAVVKATAGRIAKVVIIAPGSGSGAFTINDCATTGTATTANEIWTMAYNATANVAGAVITLDFPVAVGIVVSAVPGAGSPQIAVSYS